MARSSYEAAAKDMREAREILRTGRTTIELEELQEIATNSKVLNTYVNGVFRLLKVEDRVFKSYAIRRSLEDRARSLALTEMRQGKIARGQVGQRTKEILEAPPEDLSAAALLDGEIATFNEVNRLAEGVSAFKEKLGPGSRLASDLLLPFVRTPTNIIRKLFEYTFGSVYGAQGIARTLAGEAFTEAQQRAFALAFGRGSVGASLITLGWKLHDAGLMTGLVEDQPSLRNRDTAAGRIPGAIRINGTWHQVAGFSPIGNFNGHRRDAGA